MAPTWFQGRILYIFRRYINLEGLFEGLLFFSRPPPAWVFLFTTNFVRFCSMSQENLRFCSIIFIFTPLHTHHLGTVHADFPRKSSKNGNFIVSSLGGPFFLGHPVYSYKKRVILGFSHFWHPETCKILGWTGFTSKICFWGVKWKWQCDNSELLHCHSGNWKFSQSDNVLTHNICWLSSFWGTIFGPEVIYHQPHSITQTKLWYQLSSNFGTTLTLNANFSKL